MDGGVVGTPVKVVGLILGPSTPVTQTRVLNSQGLGKKMVGSSTGSGREKRTGKGGGTGRGMSSRCLVGISLHMPSAHRGFHVSPNNSNAISPAVQAPDLGLVSPLLFHAMFNSSRNPVHSTFKVT